MNKEFVFTNQQIWTVVHNFGIYPLVETVLTNGNKIYAKSVKHIDINTVQIEWTAAESGTAIVSI